MRLFFRLPACPSLPLSSFISVEYNNQETSTYKFNPLFASSMGAYMIIMKNDGKGLGFELHLHHASTLLRK